MLRRAALGGAPARPLAALLLLQLLLLSWAVASAGAAECLFPSLPTGAFHVVIAGWQRRPLQCFQHYLNEMGLTNARVFAYRRTEPHQPSFPPLRSSCGNVIEDRLLLPNHGREAAAFFDWVVEHYDSPPTSVVFLHGHGPHSWHTACQPVIARTRLAYTHYSDPDTADLIARHAVTLTWLDPAKNGPGQDIPRRAVNLSTEIAGYQSTKAAQACFAILAKVNLTVPERAPSCCASFVAAGERIRRYPKWFWRELRATALRPDIPDWIFGRLCFEYVIYELLGEPLPPLDPYLEDFYVKASAMKASCQRLDDPCPETESVKYVEWYQVPASRGAPPGAGGAVTEDLIGISGEALRSPGCRAASGPRCKHVRKVVAGGIGAGP